MKLRKFSPCNSQLALPAGNSLGFPEKGLRTAHDHWLALITNSFGASCSAYLHCNVTVHDQHMEEGPNSPIPICLHVAVHFHFFYNSPGFLTALSAAVAHAGL